MYIFKKVKLFVLVILVTIFTGCGGGSSSSVDTVPVTLETPQTIAIDNIKAYADDDNAPVPTIQDYEYVGVVGITSENIDDVNEVVAGLTLSDVDTTDKIQNEVIIITGNITLVGDGGDIPTAQDHTRTWVGDFEHGPMPLTRDNSESPWYEQGNLAEVVTAPEPVRNGTYAVKFFVDRLESSDSRRSMIIPKGNEPYANMQDIGKHWWYGFSTYFPDSWTTDNIWDLVAQMHARPDLDIGEDYRNPFLTWETDGDNITINNKWDAKRNTYESGSRVYDGDRVLWKGPILKEQWTDWVMHAKWSYLDDGIIEIWRNGIKIVDSRGPNCFNDERGPYFDIGIYKGWADRVEPAGMVGTRLIYFDEIWIAGE